MRKSKLPLLLLGLVLSFMALPAPPASAVQQCLCEIICWDYGTQYCWQDECCRLHCCDVGDPTCWTPCW